MVTKQEQLEWLAKAWEKFPDGRHKVFMSVYQCGDFVGLHAVGKHEITQEEWQEERDKMQNEKSVITGGIYLSRNGFMFEVVDIAKAGGDCSIDMVVYMNLDATNDFPPGQKWVLELESFIRKFKLDVGRKPAPDNSWHGRGEFPLVGCECEVAPKSGGAWIKAVILAVTNQNVIMLVNDEPLEVVSRASNVIFRPLRTEREKAIEEMSEALIHRGSAMSQVILGELYDAGFRMEKPQ